MSGMPRTSDLNQACTCDRLASCRAVIDVFVCTNLVNYTVALHGVRPGFDRRALLLYEAGRMLRPTLPRVWSLRIGIWSLRLVRWLAAAGLLHTLHVPHHRFNRRIALAARHARKVDYLDDGLDTRRRVPRNFDLHNVTGRPRYHTFKEYQVLPDWLAAFDVRRDTPLAQLAATAHRPPLPLDEVDHVLIESPGLRARDVIAALDLDPERTLVVRHPIVAKRGELPASCRMVEGSGHCLEASMLLYRDKSFFFGETMALVFAANSAAGLQNRLFAQLDPGQRDNLVGLRWTPLPPGRQASIADLYAVAAL